MDLPIRKLTLFEGWARIVEMKSAGLLPMDYPGPTPIVHTLRKREDIVVQPMFRHLSDLPLMCSIDVKGIEDVIHQR